MLTILICSARGEIIVLRSGKNIKGEIIFNNDEVIILRGKDGLRYQYPKAEVVTIKAEKNTIAPADTVKGTTPKRVATQVAIAGGTAHVPYKGWAGLFNAEATLGTHQIMGKEMLLGGSIGYRGVFTKEAYSWIPVQLVCQVPIELRASTRHRPLIGITAGYAFATNKQWGSGMCAALMIGWGYSFNAHSSLSMALTAQWQQTYISIVETINQMQYNNTIGCSIVGLAIKASMQF